MSFFDELKRRKVFKVGAAYLVVGWLVIEVAATILPQFDLPAWTPRMVTLLVALGLPIVLVMAWVFDITPEGIKADPSRAGSKRVIGVAVILAVLAVGWFFHDRTTAPVASSASTASVASTPPPTTAAIDNSIAVLPFVDMSQEQDQEYFSDGLSEELLNLLAQLPQIRVIARTSSFSFKGKEVDVATIARTLNVEHLLEGSVRKSGNTLRVTAQLIRASDSSHLWSQTYDRELTDVFMVQDEIAAAVVDALKVKLLPHQQLSNPYQSSNSEAHNQYLLGKKFYNLQTQDDLNRAAIAFRRAIDLDPDYGAPRAELALVEYFLADIAGDPASKQHAMDIADQAVAKAPQLADAYAARGIIRLSFFREWDGARTDFERALQLNTASSGAQVGNYRLLMALGHSADAAEAARKATVIDPLLLEAWNDLGRALYATGDHAAARQAFQRAREISPNSIYTGFAAGLNELMQGHAQEALAEFRTAGNIYRPAGIAMAEYSLGHESESQQALEEGVSTYGAAGAYQIAEAYAWRGDTDKAFEWLDTAHAYNDGGLSFLKSDPIMDKLSGDPRYAALLEKLGLPE